MIVHYYILSAGWRLATKLRFYVGSYILKSYRILGNFPACMMQPCRLFFRIVFCAGGGKKGKGLSLILEWERYPVPVCPNARMIFSKLVYV